MRTIIFILSVVILFSADLLAQTVSMHMPTIEDEVYFDPKDTVHLPHLGQNEILDRILDITMKRKTKVLRASSAGAIADDVPFHIPVRIWAYRDNNGTNPALSDNDIYALLDSVNRRYAEAGTGIQFYMRCPITHVNDTYFNRIEDGFDFWGMTSLSGRHDDYALNWHLVRSFTNANGMASYPWTPLTASFSLAVWYDGVLDRRKVITTVHEIGHTLGVLHTHDNTRGVGDYNGDADDCFQEAVSRDRRQRIGCARTYRGRKCALNGDALCDTEAAPNKKSNTHIAVGSYCNYTGGGTDNWGDAWNPPIRNYMSYVGREGLCRGEFTQGQIAVMHMNIMQHMVKPHSWYNLHSIGLNGTVSSGEKESFTIPQRIVAAKNNPYTIRSGATVNLHAGEEIELRPGFHVEEGAEFSAKVAPLTTCASTLSNVPRFGLSVIKANNSMLNEKDINECTAIIRKALNREYIKSNEQVLSSE